MRNVWIAGGGSGHGFKHGPAFGDYLSNRLLGRGGDPDFDAAFRLKEGTF
jgi:glycine/D-amino acid oxidase-like deaminating enzyme